MNPFNKVFLFLALLPQKLYQFWGVNMPQLKSILTYKLIMDDRRPNTFQATRANTNTEKEISNATIWTMLTSFIVGLSFLIVFYLGDDYIAQFTLYFSMFIVFLCMTLVGDFTGVLIDVRDTYIVLPKPVNDQTVVLSRLLHIFIHLCKLVVPMCLPTFLYLSIYGSIGKAAVFLLCTVLAILFSIFLINAVYILILRVTTPERFKNVISYFQIAFTILIFGAYHFMPRMSNDDDFQKLSLAASDWLIVAPPYWFACLFQVVMGLEATLIQYVAASLGILAPLASIYVVVRFLAPAFNQKLAMISGASEGGSTENTSSGVRENTGFVSSIARLLSNNKQEQTGFLFAWKMMLRSREFKLKVYPTIGYMAVLLGLNVYRSRTLGYEEGLGSMLLFSTYVSGLVIVIATSAIAYSDKFKAAWIFLVTPIEKPGEVISGALKAVLFMFYSVVVLLVLTAGIGMLGFSVLPSLLFALVNVLLINYGLAFLNFRHLPFSASPSEMNNGSQTMMTMMVMFVAGLLGLLHYFLLKKTVVLWIGLLVSSTLVKLLINAIRKKSWDSILTED
jgi:ABC-2 type transport system permease protein